MTTLRPELPPATMRIAKLPIDHRGYPVPWFVAWADENGVRVEPGQGQPDHRLVGAGNVELALATRICWICGEPIAAPYAFLIGPMCAVTRTTSEPGAHLDCAHWSVKGCPFVSRPHARRRESGMPPVTHDAPGIAIMRNPGVMAIWHTRSFETFSDGRGGMLLRVGKPTKVEWWAEGREATREEVVASIDSGIPILIEQAQLQGARALEALDRQKQTVMKKYLPRR